jgi:phosphoribosylformylglycinamidine (FGAM) synthase-like amidotransferase family enzyme
MQAELGATPQNVFGRHRPLVAAQVVHFRGIKPRKHFFAKPILTRAFGSRRRAVMTVGNGEGAFFADADTLSRIEGEGQVVFRYVDNPNGSLGDIAGLINTGGNVLGLMPHPDRSFEPELGSADGALLFQSLLETA